MAQKTRVIFVDDLSGDELPEGQGQTVTFGLDGTSYEIDLNREHADELREAVKRYVNAARKIGRAQQQRTSSRDAQSRQDVQAVREWAKANGHEVSERGRLPKSITEAYAAAH